MKLTDLVNMDAGSAIDWLIENQYSFELAPIDQHRNNPAVSAISFALETDEGEFDIIREEWSDCPDDVFDGADPLFKIRGE